MSSRINLELASEVFNRHPGVLAAWIFGSAQGGRPPDRTDLDIGVLFLKAPSLNQQADLRADLQDALQFDDIDLIKLNDASPILRFEAVSGRRLYCRDVSRMAEFVSLTAREYEDAMAMLAWGLAQRPSSP